VTLVGRRLGDFVVRDKIGEGGFGAVYRAEQESLGREAVIKVLHTHLRSAADITGRFLREAKLASRLDHPYAAHIYAFGAEPDGLLWIAMEMVRGTPLAQVLKLQGRLPLERFVPLLDRICEVVHAAHEQGIVHRDLKPANVMVIARSGRLLPKLLDFGIAKAIGGEPEPAATAPAPADLGVTEAGTVIGSPLYMAPEQWIDSKLVEPRTDLYALGVLAFECLTGHVPFRGPDRAQTARAHMKKTVPPLGDGFPPGLDAVLARALAKEPKDRYASALELAAAFRGAAGLGDDKETLPRLDDALRREILDAPQPIAEAAAAFDAARNVSQARDAAWELVHVTVRFVGILALACHARVRPGPDGPDLVDRLRSLRRRELSHEEWLDLARALVRPFEARRDAHALPGLVAFLLGPASEPLDRLIAQRDSSTAGASTRGQLERVVPDLVALVRALSFMADHALVTPRGRTGERWMGPRRVRRTAIALPEGPLVDGEPVLVDADGHPAVVLAPLVQVAPPTPGAPDEMFLFDGRGRRGARLVAAPVGFERQDDAVWDWMRTALLVAGDADGAAPADERPPYRGLAAFHAEDAALFFGRERQVEGFVNRLRVEAFLAVVGPSGAGKSSFVHAGVVPALAEGWRAIAVRPGPAPAAALTARLGAEGIDLPDLALLGDRLRAAAARHAGPILLVVDQLEELFTMVHDADERDRYARALAGAARFPDDPVRVVATLRDDFLVRAAELEPLRDRLALGLQLLTTPAPEDLRRILVEPARRAGYDFDDADLPGRMVAAVQDQPAALALLSFTASKLWELRDRQFRHLTRKAYDAMGGVGGALGQHAEATLAGMSAEEQRLVRQAFRHLVTAEGMRAVLSRGELGQVLAAPAADAVIEKLVASRLLTASEGEGIEVIHETLITAWPRLADWRREDAEGARLRDQLRAAARQWNERGRPQGLLWRGEALDEYRLWRPRYPGALTEVEEAFGAASVRDAARGRTRRRVLVAAAFVALVAVVVIQLRSNAAVNEQRRLAEARLADSYQEQGRRAFLVGDPMRALVWLIEAQRAGGASPGLRYLLARAKGALAQERLSLTVGDPVTVVAFVGGGRVVTGSFAGKLAVWDERSGARARDLAGHAGEIRSVAVSPDGRLLLTASDDRTAKVWDLATGELVRALAHPDVVSAAAFSPDGAEIVTGGGDARARVWRVADGTVRVELSGHTTRLGPTSFSPDGARIVTSDRDGSVRLWDARTGAELHALAAGPPGARVYAASFGRDGKRVVTAAATAGALWDAATGARLATFQHAGGVLAAELGPGDRAVTASDDGVVRLWAPDGTLAHTLLGHAGAVAAVHFSADGALLATAGVDGTARVWDAGTGLPIASDAGHVRKVFTMAWRPDGAEIVTGSLDGTAKVWAPSSQRRMSVRAAAPRELYFAAARADGAVLAATETSLTLYAPDGAVLGSVPAGDDREGAFSVAVFARDGTIVDAREHGLCELRDPRTLAPTATYRGHDLIYPAISPDGRRVAAFARGGEVLVWDVGGGQPRTLVGHGGTGGTVDFDPTGTRLLSASNEGVAIVWDVASGKPILTLRQPTVIASALYSRDGRRILAAGDDGNARIFDAATGKLVQALEGNESQLIFGAFDDRGERIVLAAHDGTARIWDADGGALLDTGFAHSAGLASAVFSPRGDILVTAGDDGYVRTWDVSLDAAPAAENVAFQRCRVPFTLAGGQLLPVPTVCR
jgi:WD40 repeat protein